MLTRKVKKEKPNEIIVIAPASPPLQEKSIDENLQRLATKGFEIIEGKNLRKRNGFLAGSDSERLKDLHDAFSNKHGDIILCYRGGSGAGRLLNKINPRIIMNSKKKFIGYSDITALHLLFSKIGYKNHYHGPVLKDIFNSSYSFNSFCNSINEIPQTIDKRNKVEIVRKGKIVAPILGGNISLISSLVGTPYLPSFKGKILLIEEVDEHPYTIDRMMTHLVNSKTLDGIVGIILGTCINCLKANNKKEYQQSYQDVIIERLSKFKVPFIMNAPIGHGKYNATLPLGKKVLLDASGGSLIF